MPVRNRKRKSIRKLMDFAQESAEKAPKPKKENEEMNGLDPAIDSNIESLQKELGNSTDFISRIIEIPGVRPLKIAIVYMDGLANCDSIQQNILHSLLERCEQCLQSEPDENPFTVLKDSAISIGEVKETSKLGEVLHTILCGDTCVLVEGCTKALILGTRGFKERSVSEPSSQGVVRGPKDAFTETIRTNTSLVRRRIRDASLRLDTKEVGTVTKTEVGIMYLDGIVDEQVLKEVHKRIDEIEIDAILESGYIEELIQDQTYTPFPTIYSTERPDVIVAGILEGRVGILVDGTPFALLVPAIFTQFFQSSEDYYQRADFSSLNRILRFASFLLALLVPASYIAVTTFHQEMLPTPLLISLAAQREGIPFPAIVEVIIMEVTFEILREAGIRLPRAVGAAISIVGALVLGEAVVQAGLVSPAMVIIVAFTAITSFVLPAYNFAIAVRIIRFVFMALAASFGLYGIILGLIVLVVHLCSLRSFGVPYMESFGPFNLRDQKDSFIRLPFKNLLTRPKLIGQNNEVRQKKVK